MSGSSLLTGLIAQAGYWLGESTEFKNNSSGVYETFENSDFVAVNNELMDAKGVSISHKLWYQESIFETFRVSANEPLSDQARAVLNALMQHQPWLIKDPKLWVTLPYWLDKFEKNNLQVILLSRESKALWASQVLKRTIYDFNYLKQAEKTSKTRIEHFLEKEGVSFISIEYDDLIEYTQKNLQKINRFLGVNLTFKDWQKVYKPKRQSSNQWIEKLIVWLIYFKNYFERIK